MNVAKVEENLKKILEQYGNDDFKENFIFELLLAYGISKTTITLVKKGNSNLSKKANQLILKKKIFFESTESKDLYSIIDNLKNEKQTYTHKPRFIIVTNFENLLAIDTKTKESLDTPLKELCKHADFFLPWTGKEKYIAPLENIADVRAAEKMAKIYDEIVKLNPDLTKNHNHALNIFLTRLLFCFFAEDTGIFDGEQLFTKTLSDGSKDDGSDLDIFLDQLFESLDKEDKSIYPNYLHKFPYVNGKLFSEKHSIPKMSAKIKSLIIECGNEDWKEINPDIFGSMFQAVASAEVRSGLGQHYTSVPNIMKVIEPLFLNDLQEEFEKAFDDEKKLNKLLRRIYYIKIFDPACGSGNFLIIAYKELRKLEMEIIQRIQEVLGQTTLKIMLSNIHLNQFYGIEIDDFACEIAKLSLWLAEHQMNRKFKEQFGDCNPSLPLTASGNIVCGNATRLEWEKVCPKGIKGITKSKMEQMTLLEIQQTKQLEFQSHENEIYILGNPPYLGTRNQKEEHKFDIAKVFSGIKNYKNLDYIACWLLLARKYIKNMNAKYAFVSTNSICQGDQVALLWPHILEEESEIFFAYQSFKWANNAKKNAGVTCVIIGIRNKSNSPKFLFKENIKTEVKNINGYLLDSNNVYIGRKSKPVSKIPEMTYGNYTGGCPALMLSAEEKNEIIASDRNASKFIRPLSGSKEFINNIPRYCLWIKNEDLNEANSITTIKKRIEDVKKSRLAADDVCIQKLAERPHQFRDTRESKSTSIIMPVVSSERREYIPCGFLSKEVIIPNSAQAI
ncbi:MAG: DNA methyltransferase, partial [bacterium]